MEHTIKTKKGNFRLFYREDDVKDDGTRFAYKITVEREKKGNTTTRSTTFKLFGSMADHKEGKMLGGSFCDIAKGDKGFLREFGFALRDFVSDAIAYLSAKDIDDFQTNFGYEKASETLKAWKGCKRAAIKLARLDLSHSDIFALNDELAKRFG